MRPHWTTLVAAALTAALPLGGCVVRSAADPDRARMAAPPPRLDGSTWPERRPEPFFPAVQLDPEWSKMWPVEPLRETDLGAVLGRPVTVNTLGLYGRTGAKGQLTEIRAAQERAPWSEVYVFRSWSGGPGSGRIVEELTQEAGRIGRLRAVSEYGMSTVMALFEPENRPARGLVVHLTGLTGLSPERDVVRAMTRRGWAVLVVEPPSHGLEVASKRTFRLLTVAFTMVPSEDEIAEPMDPEVEIGIAAAMAELQVRQYLAEWSYAVEAALECLREKRPDIPQRPLALAGFSMGAIALPAVASRIPDHVDAAVLVAGGANILEMARRSSLGVALRTRVNGRELSREELRRVETVYARIARLDPLNAAAALRGVPVLMLHAQFDAIVPSECGDVLYERLGRPERWTYPVGHLGLYWLLDWHAPSIAKWLGRMLPEAR